MPTKSLPSNVLLAGDCAEVMSEFPDNSIDMILTSPPYDNLRDYDGYIFDAEKIAYEMLRVAKHGAAAVWVVGDQRKGGVSMTSFKQGVMFQEIGWHIHDIMIYQKKNTPFARSNAYTNCYEFMFILSKGGAPKTFNPIKTATVRSGEEMLVYNKRSDGINRKKKGTLNKQKVRNNIWSYAVGLGGTTSDREAFKHPAVFPEKLAEDHIISWSNTDDIVLDPMCGSGTTCKIAAANNRRYIGIDISEDYLAIAKKRIESLSDKQM